MKSSDIAEVLGGRHHGQNVTVNAFSIDSRDIPPGALFVPIRRRLDGHRFIDDAVSNGAVAFLTEEGHASGPREATAIEVASAEAGLMRLAEHVRAQVDAKVVAVTGSVGKTSVKDLTRFVLGKARRVAASPRSYNAELGVSLTLVNTPLDAQVLVLEMGARGPGQIAALCALARPDVGIVTSVAPSHLQGFGSLEVVEATKGELAESLPETGTCILNLDDPRVRNMRARTSATTVMYSATGDTGGDVVAEGVTIDELLRTSFVMRSPWGSGPVQLSLRGIHNVENALAAAAASLAVGTPFEVVVQALREARPSENRMELLTRADGVRIIDDSYNANPKSTEAALRALAQLPADQRIAVLGPMAELGDESRTWHERIASLAHSLGISLIPVGTTEYGASPALSFDDVRRLLEESGLTNKSAVLVKGSRMAGLEGLVRMIAGGSGT